MDAQLLGSVGRVLCGGGILGSIEIELLWMSGSYAVAGVSVQSVFYEFFEPLE
ncbi:hypothetical protein F444_01073 [Phytophthora nicotianae P1976]|uniref:Uncharacterized protein n=1 Tax=Phytophthora nicotianae P1976 TaxID=1317066 RepID=A0A081B1U4_PHYNI|nr:hypothetical protein F444_01073 [Phytophthora nicotianae P1976]